MASLDSEIDRLFALPRERFVEARNELAARLRADGKDADARAVTSLRRPTMAAWVANELARTHAAEVESLLRAGAELRSAQDRAIRGGGRGGLREPTSRRRSALKPLRDAAAAILARAGKSAPTHLDDVVATLEAASADEASGELLRRGRLSSELAPSDVDPFTSGSAALPIRGRSLSRTRGVPEAREARRERDELAREAVVARRAAEKAMRAAEEAAANAERLERLAEQARERAAAARGRVRAALSNARQAEREAERKERAATEGRKKPSRRP